MIRGFEKRRLDILKAKKRDEKLEAGQEGRGHAESREARKYYIQYNIQVWHS